MNAPRSRHRAVFLDRDGTLNIHAGYVVSPEQLQVYGFAGPAVRRLNESGWLVIVVTNQGVLARGACSLADMNAIHDKLNAELAAAGAWLDDIRICPHHPSVPIPAHVDGRCRCRKPLPGMLLDAARDLDIDLAASWTVGDSSGDIAAGAAAGTRTILVGTGLSGRDDIADLRPDHVAANVLEAARLIIREE